MANPYFQFKQFTVYHDRCAMKVTTDGCLFGAWCAQELSRMADKGAAPITSLLDIGTGTGLLSLMVAQKLAVPIQAIEIEDSAASQAEANVAASPFKDQITVAQQDILQLEGTRYDVILSNPPFYENELSSGSPAKDTAHHSYQLSWAGLFAAIDRLLKPDGRFYLLLPFKRAAELERFVSRENLFVNKTVTVAPSAAHSPFRLLVQGSRKQTALVQEQLAVRDTGQQYTPEFKALLKDYYLYL